MVGNNTSAAQDPQVWALPGNGLPARVKRR